MLIPPSVTELLLDAGVVVRPRGARTAELEAPDGSTETFHVIAQRQPVPPSHMSRLQKTVVNSPEAVLLIVPTTTPAAADAARSLGWSVITYADPQPGRPVGFLRIGGTEVDLGGELPQPAAGPSRRGRKAWGALAVARLLLEGGSWTQSSLSRRAGVSQPLVSLELNRLLDDALLTTSPRSRTTLWTVSDWDALLDRWLQMYPGPGGIATYWYGLDDVARQVDAAVRALDAPGARVAVSGDAAADVLAPWRRPQRGVVYASAPDLDRLSSAGLTPSGPEEATLHVVVPEDPGIWLTSTDDDATSRPRRGEDLLAHPTQVLWDVRHSSGPDVDQAVEVLTTALRRRAEVADDQQREAP